MKETIKDCLNQNNNLTENNWTKLKSDQIKIKHDPSNICTRRDVKNPTKKILKNKTEDRKVNIELKYKKVR